MIVFLVNEPHQREEEDSTVNMCKNLNAFNVKTEKRTVNSPLCCHVSDRQSAAGCLRPAASTGAPPGTSEEHTPGRWSFPQHRTPPSPPQSLNLTETQENP